MAFYTSTSNQSMHLGTTQNELSTLVISPSNLQINGDMSLLNRRLNFTRLSVSRPTVIGTPTNVTSMVSNNTAQIAPQNGSNYDFMLSNANTNFRFLDSNGVVEASISNNGNMYIAGNISAGNLGMFRNRIINGDMRINQRGNTTQVGTNGSNIYFNDRWFLYQNITTGQVTCSNVRLTSSDSPFSSGLKTSMRMTATTTVSSYNFLYGCQRIEGFNIEDLNWGSTQGSSVTVSLWLRTNIASDSTLQVSLRNVPNSDVYNGIITTRTSGWGYYSFVVPAPPSGSIWSASNTTGIEILVGAVGISKAGAANAWTSDISNTTNWPATLNNYVEFTGVQLEKGTIATPFEFRPLAIEMELCQRYFRYAGAGGQGKFIDSGVAYEAHCGLVPAMCKVPVVTAISGNITSYVSGVGTAYQYTIANISRSGQTTATTQAITFHIQLGSSAGASAGSIFLYNDVAIANAEL